MEKYYYAGSWLLGLCQNQASESTYLPVKKRALAVLVLTLLATGSSMALSLGKYRGAALVGRPLDISVQAMLGAQDDPAALCIEADAFYADTKLDKSLVRVTTEKALSSPLDTVIRIRSSVLVDEPVVSLNVRVGCQQKSERRYVILADLASEPASLPLQPLAGGTGSTGTSAAPAATISAASNSLPTAPAASTSARRGSVRPAAALSGASGSAAEPVAARPATASAPSSKTAAAPKRDKPQASDANAPSRGTAGKARLRLEPLDLSIERDPQLRASKELLSVPATVEQRAAAAALWRALTTQPQDIAQDAGKIQALENSLKALRAQTQKDQLALNELNSQLEKSQSEQYANWLVYALSALLILALAGLLYVRRRRVLTDEASAHALPWWRKNKPLEKGWTDNFTESVFDVSPGVAQPENAYSPAVKNKHARNAKTALGANESTVTQARPMSIRGSDSQLSALSAFDFTVSMSQVGRSVKAEELFDVQQQADFFVSLGQHEQAVELLRGHITGNSQISPLVYMDLFNLYHQLDRPADYEALRKDFNQLFTGNIPAFELYTHSSAGLEAYPVALTRIEALWPSPKVLEVIEESILRKPVANADTFDLEAYRELLLLYAVAKEVVHSQRGRTSGALRFDLPETLPSDLVARVSGFSMTAVQPLSARVDNSADIDIDLLLPPVSPRLALDIDLDNLVENTNASLPGVGMQSNPDANFSARLGTNLPVVPGVTPSQADNLIDFDDFDAFLENPAPAGAPKG